MPLKEIAPGDWLLIRQGDVVLVDGMVVSDMALPRHLGANWFALNNS
ncbi:hypothetical protein [Meridianimarinicoccus zhengii]|nr:hypothetical protein [Phycocomes zhengii]